MLLIKLIANSLDDARYVGLYWRMSLQQRLYKLFFNCGNCKVLNSQSEFDISRIVLKKKNSYKNKLPCCIMIGF